MERQFIIHHSADKPIHFSDILRIQTMAVMLKASPPLLSFSAISES